MTKTDILVSLGFNSSFSSLLVISLILLVIVITVILFVSPFQLHAINSSSTFNSTAPGVVRVFPSEDYNYFRAPAYITVRFNVPVMNSSVDDSSFMVKDSSGSEIQGTVTMTLSNGVYDPHFVKFKPEAIKGNETYTVKLQGIKDLAGNTIPSHEWSFTITDPSKVIIRKGDSSQAPPGDSSGGIVRDDRNLSSETLPSTSPDKKLPFTYKNGLPFPNNYQTTWTVIPDKYIPDFIHKGDIEFTTIGRCGGMAFVALDLYYANKRIPGYTTVPPNDNPLSEYILDRFKDSLDVSFIGILKALGSVALSHSPLGTVSNLEEAPRFLYLTFAPHENKNTIAGKCTVGCIPGVRPLTNIEVKKATRSLDQGMPVVFGLIKGNTADSLKGSHQVVAYKYTFNKQANNQYTFYIYDSVYPGKELKATWYPSNVGGKLYYSYETFDKNGFTKVTKPPWRGFFVEDYTAQVPPDFIVDRDFDGIEDLKDNCRDTANPDQKNSNSDEFGDACQTGDQDEDGVIDSIDNCRWVANPEQNTDACKDVIL